MKYAIAKLVSLILGIALFGAVAYWARETPSLTDGQYIGFPLLAAMLAACIVGTVWEKCNELRRAQRLYYGK